MADVKLEVIIKSEHVKEVGDTLAEIYAKEIYDEDDKIVLNLKDKAKSAILHLIKKEVLKRRKRMAKKNVTKIESNMVV